MKQTKSEFKLKSEELEKQAFTDEVINNELIYDTLLDELEINTFQDVSVYSYGGILSIKIELTEINKKVTDKFIKDYHAYNKLTEHRIGCDTKDNFIDLSTLAEFVYDNFYKEIIFDKSNEQFLYN